MIKIGNNRFTKNSEFELLNSWKTESVTEKKKLSLSETYTLPIKAPIVAT
jgi:hypothetical protein